MPCYSPLKAYRSRIHTKKGKPGITFERKDSNGQEVSLPCGQCSGCRQRRARDWAIRCMHEAQMHASNYFVTLTYDDEHLPLVGGEYPTLNHRDFQLFMKRLRKASGQKIRYYMCGEYGPSTKRPHYHALFFGLDLPDLKLFSKDENHAYFTSERLTGCWQKGHVLIGAVDYSSARYVAGYIHKKRIGKDTDFHYSYTDAATGEVIPVAHEYSRMSLRPGIATEWWNTYKDETCTHDYVIMRGQQYPLPKFYDKKIEEEDEKFLDFMKSLRSMQTAEYWNSLPDEELARIDRNKKALQKRRQLRGSKL